MMSPTDYIGGMSRPSFPRYSMLSNYFSYQSDPKTRKRKIQQQFRQKHHSVSLWHQIIFFSFGCSKHPLMLTGAYAFSQFLLLCFFLKKLFLIYEKFHHCSKHLFLLPFLYLDEWNQQNEGKKGNSWETKNETSLMLYGCYTVIRLLQIRY